MSECRLLLAGWKINQHPNLNVEQILFKQTQLHTSDSKLDASHQAAEARVPSAALFHERLMSVTPFL
jgi:hypothetical protein